jgi:hypothetical protein
MFYIVESDNQIERLQEFSQEKVYLEVVSNNYNYHPKLSYTVAVYLRPVSESQGYIIPINHDEGLNVTKDRIYEVLKTFKYLFTYDKKQLLYHFVLPDVTDIQLLSTAVDYKKVELPNSNNTINWYYNKYPDYNDVNRIIPITKLYQKCEENYKAIECILQYEIPNGFDFYNKTATSVFYLIEQSGLRVTYKEYLELFKPNNPVFNMENNIAYTYYNLYNITSRPTNAFNSVNYAAIPKAPEFRKAIIPQNDYFVEMDFDGYHLRLLCEQIGYELTDEPAHMQLAKLYFGKDEIAEEDYAKAKQINFHAIYGKIPPEYAFLPIFERIQNFINRLWQHFQEKGYVEDPISGRKFTNNLPDMHPQKLMNYMMQSLETSRNILILKDILKYLQNKKTKIALYTYDAIVFDFDKKEGKEVLINIENIMNNGGNYPIKFKYSNNLVL